jgi:ribosomal protein S18 acetylase RimI-like enzyme
MLRIIAMCQPASHPVQDLSPMALASAVEANVAAQYPLMYAHLPTAQVFEDQRLLGITTGLPGLNGVFLTHLAPEEVDPAIEGVLDRHRQRGITQVEWFITPSTRPPDLGRYLEAHRFRYAVTTVGMAADLRTLPEPAPHPAGLIVELVHDVEQLRSWLHPLQAGFHLPEAQTTARYELFARQGFGPEVPWRLYNGVLEGQVVAASRLFCAAGVAGIYDVATLPRARGQGVGTAMTLAPLLEARDLGYRLGVLGAAEEGQRLYRRLGFRECCCFGLYVRQLPGTTPTLGAGP